MKRQFWFVRLQLNVNTMHVLRNHDESALRESLKSCSPATSAAARAFLHTRDLGHVPTIVTGIIESHLEPELHARLATGGNTLRLREDLGLDSLCMMEIVLVLDDVLQLPISNDELARLRTLGDVLHYVQSNVRSMQTIANHGGAGIVDDSAPLIAPLGAPQTSG